VESLAFFVLKGRTAMKSAIFFERDGILNECRVERGQQMSPRTLDDFRVNLDAREPLQRLRTRGF
jgi:histidinol phosphatase-like enzyme